ncbi:acyl-homoserine-lactone synthase [Nitrosovibrio sp. Nv17]|uniref:acyl-homoserine-lactone synthase n=1 Tax=Nitrosovibrio sp. Nv17 TaxID=1855339 RepID=UPI000908CBEB|nr:acyl-homoserine-lactone synthase [Nitrosovibrio sp. Nv17]SFW26918.1 acyl homoserine lactone synthase [Nitrosovibrio sp. Nv17]
MRVGNIDRNFALREMTMQIILARYGNGLLERQEIMAMYRLRHDIFHDRLGWEVTVDNGMERDEFDHADPVYMLAKDAEDGVMGCWRLLPTTGPNMLRDVFPQLLHGQPAPSRADVWELSRFAVLLPRHESAGFGFSAIPVEMMRILFFFARDYGIKRYVTVATVAVERLIRKLGVNVSRLGAPIRIGRVMTVACYIEIDAVTELALFGGRAGRPQRKAA